MMKKSILGFIVYALMVLPSCTPYVESEGAGSMREDMSALPNNFSLMDLGRAISLGSVDIFDPWLTSLEMPLMASDAISTPSTFPEHPYMLIRDDSVTAYSLDNENKSPASDDFFKMMEDLSSDDPVSITPPVSVIESEPL